MNAPKPGEIVTDGKNVTIGAPLVKATGGPPQKPSEALNIVTRHLKGMLGGMEQLKTLMEKEEGEKEKE